jgi:PAS domain S-box-containing protein
MKIGAHKDYYRHLFELSLDPIVILDSDGRLLEMNKAACKLLDCGSKDEFGQMNLARLGIEKEKFPDLRRSARENEVVRWEFTLTDPEPRILEVGLAPLPYQGYNGTLYQWVAHDMTERVRLEDARQKLVHMIVHDLRVPLGNVLNSLDLVLTAWRERDVTIPVEQVLGIGLRSANRMERLVSDILDSARLQAGERALSITEIDVAAMVAEAVDTLAASVSRHRHTLSIHVVPDLPELTGDPDLLRRVLINLLNNAIKYTQDEGEISVNVRMTDEGFRFAVTDNGPGISPEDQQHIFELFFRGHLRRSKGVGIGLAFCKLAVEAHGGRIWLESKLGEGSSFYFTIPLTLPEDEAAQLEARI